MRRATVVGAALIAIARAACAQEPPVTVPKSAAPDEAQPDPIVGTRSLVVLAPFGPSGLRFVPRGEVFAQYALGAQWANDGSSSFFHQFDLTRGFLGAYGEYRGAHGGALLEATRSANEGGVIGVAGNAYVMAVREAYAGYTHRFSRFGDATVRLGIQPTFTVPAIEEAWRLRAVDKVTVERAAFENPADVGITGRWDAPKSWGTLQIGLFNGEGYQKPELNRGKNFSAAIALHPVAPVKALRPLTVLVSYTNGSVGAASARSDRLTVGLLWSHPRISAGFDTSFAWGMANDASKEAWALEGFARVEPIEDLILGARASYIARDSHVAGDSVVQVIGTVGYRVFTPLEVYVAFERNMPASVARTALAGQDTADARLVARFWF